MFVEFMAQFDIYLEEDLSAMISVYIKRLFLF